MDYIHYNPVKHGHVKRPSDWRYSSFHRLTKEGMYSFDWGYCKPQEIEGMEYE